MKLTGQEKFYHPIEDSFIVPLRNGDAATEVTD